jgi:hypothetical protein
MRTRAFTRPENIGQENWGGASDKPNAPIANRFRPDLLHAMST